VALILLALCVYRSFSAPSIEQQIDDLFKCGESIREALRLHQEANSLRSRYEWAQYDGFKLAQWKSGARLWVQSTSGKMARQFVCRDPAWTLLTSALSDIESVFGDDEEASQRYQTVWVSKPAPDTLTNRYGLFVCGPPEPLEPFISPSGRCWAAIQCRA
jgi:hypothetical protein